VPVCSGRELATSAAMVMLPSMVSKHHLPPASPNRQPADPHTSMRARSQERS
jgi:hypothetical protein